MVILLCVGENISTVMRHIHLARVENFIGFATENVEEGETVKILTRASVTSDEPEFYTYVDQISNIFLAKPGISTNATSKFLVLIHQDLSADLYINDFKVVAWIRTKRAIQKGESVRRNDIADMGKLEFPDIKITKTDKVICCLKVGWKFGLFFDLDRRKDLDFGEMSLVLGALYRYLSFQHVYKILESEAPFKEMINDGWFPFIEIIGEEFEILSKAYRNEFDFKNRIGKLVDSFDRARIERIINKWWGNKIFKDKQSLIEAGVNAYLHDNNDGFINCIKTLSSEIEGILRFHYLSETGRGNKVKLQDLLQHIIEKGRTKSGSDYSLFLPLPFFMYLKDSVFANFNLESSKVGLSRHSSSHGVAKAGDYTKMKALQMILTLDQICFFIQP